MSVPSLVMTQKRPINADLPAAVPKISPEHSRSPHDTPSIKRRDGQAPEPSRPGRKPIPLALKAVAGLVVVAVVFLLAAVLGGGGSNGSNHIAAPVSEEGENGTIPANASQASNNTTRIGGSEPATLGAAVALTVFPSRTPAQRPAAVTLVDEENWQNAVAAAVLMAPPIRSPLLISAASGLPEASSQALTALKPAGSKYKPQGNRTTEGPQAYVLGPISTPAGLKTTKTAETTGAVQAAEIEALRDSIFRGPPKHVIVASETNAAFAVPAAAWAARSGDPVLYSRADKLPQPTVAALKRNPEIPVYVLGPASVISPGVLREIAKIDKHVRRVSGKTPAENAIALARYSSGNFGWNVNDPGHGFVIARSDAPVDAALAAPLSASGTWGPLLLTESADKLPSPVREYLLGVKPGYTTDPTRAFYNHVWIIGEPEAIDANQQAEIDQLAELTKVGGEP
jgi:hypothetical protein